VGINRRKAGKVNLHKAIGGIRKMSDNDWKASARAWVPDGGEAGDYGRQWRLDAPIGERLRRLGGGRAC
jgi:hypothetical protein